MNGVFFVETLRRSWRGAIYWGLGMGALGLYITVVLGDSKILEGYSQLISTLPPAMLQMFGISDVSALTTPEGFIGFGFFGYTLLVMAVYCITAGLNVTANEEDEGILDVVLSLPVPRRQVVLEKFLAYLVVAVAIIGVSGIALLIGVSISTLEVNVGRLIESLINMLPGTLLMLSFTVFIAALVRRKSTATGIAAFFVVASYFMNFIGSAVGGSIAQLVNRLSFFTYYDSQTVMKNGLNVANALLLVVISVVLVVGAVWAFDRRDVGV